MAVYCIFIQCWRVPQIVSLTAVNCHRSKKYARVKMYCIDIQGVTRVLLGCSMVAVIASDTEGGVDAFAVGCAVWHGNCYSKSRETR